jgi:hypothetical protein
MLKSILGLLVSAALYLGAVYAFVWAGRRRIEWASRRGVLLGPAPAVPSTSELWNRHSVDMTIIYGVFFLALGIAGFSVWQRVGFAALVAIVFGSFWIANSPNRIGLEVASPVRRMASVVGYWCLSVADWFGYLCILCFATALIMELF